MSLDILGWGKVSDFLTSIVNRIVPDPQQQLQATQALAQLEQEGEFKLIDTQLALAKAQTDINAIEAGSDKFFVAGWRPFIGWICGVALAYQFLLRPLLPWAMMLYTGHPVAAPVALDDTLTQLVYGMLGFGTLRTIEKVIPHFTK